MQRAIMDGEKETGVTVMRMDEGLDTGDMIATLRFPIGEEDDFESIHDRSAELGSALFSELLPKIESGDVVRIKQDDSLATYAKKVEREDCKIDFTLSAKKRDCIIRGTTPIPGAFTFLNGKMLKINKAKPTVGKGVPGEVIATDGVGVGSFTVACGEGALLFTEIVPEGKGRMRAADFVRGRQIQVGEVLS